MIRSLTTWMLAGALAASLAWNLRGVCEPEAPAACGTCPSASFDCARAIDSLSLTADQRRALEQCGQTACTADASGSARADELAQQLCAMLAASPLDRERALALANEISRLRSQCLRECVDSVVEVRRILTPEQVGELLGSCCKPQGD